MPGLADPRPRRRLGGDARPRPRLLVAARDENPAALAGAGQGEPAGELAAAQGEREVACLVAGDLGWALIPDDHGAAAARLSLVNALEVARGQVMIFYRHGQAPDLGIKRPAPW